MAEVDPKVMDFVEKTLKENPSIELEDLFRMARKVSDSIQDLSRRQFNARYPLQVKRRRAQAVRKKTGHEKGSPAPRRARARKAGTPSPSGGPRDTVRGVLLQFATDITAAEERKELVRVLANVDRYVDRVLQGLS